MPMEALLLTLLSELVTPQPKQPTWVLRLTELLRGAKENWILNALAHQLAIHPVQRCHQFPRYFHCHLSEHRRLIRLRKALPILLNQPSGLTHIALAYGFTDQSYSARAFRESLFVAKLLTLILFYFWSLLTPLLLKLIRLRTMAIRFCLLLACLLVRHDWLHAQSSDIVPTQGITSVVHQTNVGRIVFTTRDIAPTALTPTDFLSTYTLTNTSNLFITVFMTTSLTNYLHRLAPTLAVDSLTKAGNYQFNFYIDNRLIYQTNLHPGAPYAQLKHTETIVSKPLIDNQHEGRWWSQSAWNRFMANGGEQALTEGRHQFKLIIRPYIKLTDIHVGEPIAVGELALTVQRKPQLQLAQIKLTRPIPYDGFPVSTDSVDTDKVKALKGSIDAGVFKHITSVVVIKRGKLLIEEYFNGASRDSLHDVRSVGKSFTSTLAGIAHQEGYLKSERQVLADFYPLSSFAHYSRAKAQTSIQELLTMSSAFDGDDNQMNSPGNEENMYPTANWVKFALDLPVEPAKFSGHWHYFTAGVVLVGDILNKLVPDQLDTYSKRKLFSPLGIHHYRWQYTPQGVVSTAGGIRMNSLDLAKYGQLYQNGGRWNGQQLVPAAWVAKTFTKYKVLPGRAEEYYGYLFWNKTYHVRGKSYETYYCTGNGGNKIFVFTDHPLVVVVTATAYNSYYAHPQVDRMMEDYILPAVLK